MSSTPNPTFVSIGADIDTSTTDIVFGGQGDPQIAAGKAQYHQRIARLLSMGADDLLGSPGLGGGFASFLGRPLSSSVASEAQACAHDIIAQDSATVSIISVTVSRHNDTLYVDAVVRLTGGLTTPVTWSFPH